MLFKSLIRIESFCIFTLDQSERSIKHVCTTALMCPFYRYVRGISAIAIQLVGSLAGFIINIVLTLGIIHRIPIMLLIWLVSCLLMILGVCYWPNFFLKFHLLQISISANFVSGWIRCRNLWMHNSFWHNLKCTS